MGKKINSREKGKRGERDVAHEFQDKGFDARRGQQFSGLQGDADVVGVPYLHLEVKRTNRLQLDKAMAQSVRDAREGEIPTVIHRKDHQEWRITLALEDFIPIFMAYVEKRKEQNND